MSWGWIDIGLVVSIVLSFYGLGALGCAGLVSVVMKDARLSLRSLISAIAAPLFTLGPFLIVVIFESGWPRARSDEMAIAMVLAVLPAFVVGYPAAYFLGRALDRQRAPSLEVFE